MDRHRSDRPSGGEGGDRINGGDMPRRPPSSRWSDGGGGGDAANDHHRFPRSNAGGFNSGFNGGGGFNSGGGAGRFHPYHDGSRGSGPGFRGGPDGGFGPKRGFFGRGSGDQEYADGSKFVKLFVGSVPRTVTEEDIRPLFEEHGNVIEVALIRGRGGPQQGFCFVKYATSEEADRAVAALHNQYTLPGALSPLQVRYADGDRERQEDKLFVASLNKRATEQEIAEIFTPYGHVEDVYLMRDELKQFRGCGFVRFSNREMAAAAMNALHGTYVMRGCDNPLIVRFADPKRPRLEPRGFPTFGGPGSGHHSEMATVIRPTAKFDEPIGSSMPPNAWGTVSPQPHGPSSQAGSQGFGHVQGFGSNTSARGGAMEASSATTGMVGETGGPTGGPQSNFAAIPLQQGFNPSMPQMHSVLGQQMPPLQKPLMNPQNFPPSLQPHQNPQIPTSHAEGQKPPMQQLGQHQVPQSTGLPYNQTLPSQPLPGMSGQLPSSQPIIQQNASGTPLQTSLGLSHQGMPPMANQQQLLQRPMQQMPSQLPQVLLQQQAQALQSSFQSSQQAILQLQQQLQLMQQSGLSQQPISQNTKQQGPWSGPQLNASASTTVSTPVAVMPSAASATSMPVTTSASPLTCNWTEHTSPQGFKYYYNSVTQESKWEKPEEYSIFEQQQQQQQQQQEKLLLIQQQQQQQQQKLLLIQQQQQKLAVQQLQSPAQTQSQIQLQPNQQFSQSQIQANQQIPQTQIQPNQQIPQTQQIQNQMQFRQPSQMQLLQPSLAYQASALGNQPNIQNFNYAQPQAANSVTNTTRVQQAIQTAQELTWQNKPSGS